MPQVKSHGETINYDVEGQGPPLVLVHGFSGSRNSWRGYGFVEALKTDYQLILMDARGHGESSKPHRPEAYDYRLQVDDVISVVDDLNLPTVSYVGFSMGGMIGFGLAKYYPQRVRSLIIGGCSPFNRNDPSVAPLLDLYELAVDQGAEVLVSAFKTWFGSITPEAEARLRNADFAAGAAQLRWMKDHDPDFSDDLSAMTMPFLIYVGEAEEECAEIQEGATRLPNATFVMLPGLNHYQAGGASELLVPHFKRFLTETL